MIKAAGRTATGKPLLILGLSGENMTRLMAGEPILIDTDQLGHAFAGIPSLSVLVVGGRTEESIYADLGRLTGHASVPSYTCPRCGARSANPNDIANRYCGRCHQFEETL